MKDELTFPPAFEEHLKSIIPDRNKEERNNIKAALRQCYHIGVTKIKLDTYGSGDSGEGTDIEVCPDTLYHELTKSTREALDYYGWTNAKWLNPGYEINDGGGCRCTITFYPFTILGEAYYYVMEEHAGESFSLS